MNHLFCLKAEYVYCLTNTSLLYIKSWFSLLFPEPLRIVTKEHKAENKQVHGGGWDGVLQVADKKINSTRSTDTVTHLCFPARGQRNKSREKETRVSCSKERSQEEWGEHSMRRNNETEGKKTRKQAFCCWHGECRAKSSSDYTLIGFNITVNKANSSAWAPKSRCLWSDIKIRWAQFSILSHIIIKCSHFSLKTQKKIQILFAFN